MEDVQHKQRKAAEDSESKRRSDHRQKKERNWERHRDKRQWEAERDYSGGEDGNDDHVRERDRKRRMGEEDDRGQRSRSSCNRHNEYYSVDKIELEDPEAEQRKRRRRIQEWQEFLKRKEEEESEERELKSGGKTWTLEGESCYEENENSDATTTALQTGVNDDADQDDYDVDPLDAFMNEIVLPEVDKLNNAVPDPVTEEKLDAVGQRKRGSKISIRRIIPDEDSDSDYCTEVENDHEGPLENEDDDEFMKKVKKTKAEKLSVVDHSKVDYPTFRKSFYTEVKEIQRMTNEEVAVYRKQLELKLHGKDVPKPIKTWHQTGLSMKILEIIKKLNYEKPMPIQAQALPILMSGRDCIGTANTGSGKTLAFVLPMLRHIKDQPPLMPGDGPIGLIMAPTRELVQQIHRDIKKFTKLMNLRCVPVYGGSGVAQQIGQLKRGAEIVVCTPGRMIDMLCTNGGKITNLFRATYLVMDEADRMFDMGFQPQITRIVQNTRPDRQTVLFSATFPRQVEVLARKVLNEPVEVQVGVRSVVNKDITQLVEVIPQNERFHRLLELHEEWSKKGKILIFVHSQEKCDALFRDLIKRRCACLSLHGGKDQSDRESTISDFKNNVCNLLVATSIAARGLDVKELELVINFDVPGHYEDYVHRVGRTGRAGRKGCAVTFLSEEDARYAPDLVKALEMSEQVVPDNLKALAHGFIAKVNQGLEKSHGTGYGGSGFKFNVEEDEVMRAAKKVQAKGYGFEEDKSYSEVDDDDDGVLQKAGNDLTQQAPAIAASRASTPQISPSQLPQNGGLPVPLPSVFGLTRSGIPSVGTGPSLPSAANDGAVARAVALAAVMNLKYNLARIQADTPEYYEAELEINDFPQNVRWKVTQKGTLGPISEWTGAAITTRGQYFPPGIMAGPGERKLYLFIEGPNEQSVKKAKAELKRVLQDITTQAISLPNAEPGRYSVV